jgi:hypothetical protein
MTDLQVRPRPIVVLGDGTARHTAHCRSCGREIHWFTTAKHEKAIPVDAAPDYQVVSTTREFGRQLTTINAVAHWATCPDADRWRR